MIGRGVGFVFSRAVFPTLCVVAIVYFGYYAYFGERGVLALQSTRQTLRGKETELSAKTAERKRLERRIGLVKAKDHDIIEELARTKLMDGAPGQVAIPRDDAGAPAH